MKIEGQQKLKNHRILVIASGSIAAVKTPLLISQLIKAGAEVRCVITSSASELVSPLSLSTLSRNYCYQDQDQWDPKTIRPLHIELSEWANVVVVAPLSASSLSRWVNGLGEGLAASVLLASEKPVIAVAAMNTAMWDNPAVKKNWIALKEFKNVTALSPSEGLLACDRIGEGRMSNPDIIQLAIESAKVQMEKKVEFEKDWEGINLLVSAGKTIEDIDAARYITNRSSGKMGILLAQAARFRGATVHLVHGELQIKPSLLEGLNSFQVRSAQDMYKTMEKLQKESDVIAMTAAVADIKTNTHANIKVSKRDLLETLKDRFEIVPDLLKNLISNKKENQIFLGFAALTGSDEEIKRLGISKKDQKGCDLLMANPIDRLNQGFGSEFNGGWLIGPEQHVEKIPVDCKLSLAHHLLDVLKTNFIDQIKIK
ncbi:MULTISPECIES: bifunctional phosphopantothenoylcysteine decarboxylase/phosphopantothenate--cysteine ligase CoaBC [unclassified Prochlorococcus]|uniref:bifunctional phosphopantothenoylcysteine decarboxylase/phosphopantothenate--cysteine ligase CoaBC n=1 Tax=unclassified Prochlorococcus TaxID=2627481 RepID=UPI0005338AC4|nr:MULTISPECIES: bifunctional phosphopantothenoylcysteine decarboxylase/phosphopantothenate--cysteine ligase CoaBC [unclassified Prochlorococcus]KGG16703.1 Phosphopantothenoylcysteine decarboxylase [Prochlorococcus sp. MIT 0602]KGG18325.1 Phosphopantothenoylcysteine decarboxylase [Prochlorococcus sp. MIT 0603]